MRKNLISALYSICEAEPEAYALVYGSEEYYEIQGSVYFFPLWGGTLVAAEVTGLPEGENYCDGHFFGFHIHEKAENVPETKMILLPMLESIIIPMDVIIRIMSEICLHFRQTEDMHS